MLRTLKLTVAMALAVILQASQPSQSTKSQPAVQGRLSAQNISANKGSVEKNTYKNASLGLEFTPPDNLQLGDPEMKGTPGSLPLLVTVSSGERGLLSGLFSARSVLVFYAEDLAYYPEDQRNAARYLKKVIAANAKEGFEVVDGKPNAEISGIPFLRADFSKKEVHETVLVTPHNGFAFVFIFAGANVKTTDELLASTTIKLTN